MMMSLELSVLTLNVWGIPFISSDRTERMQHIGLELATGKYDIVSLQEVWAEKDILVLQELTKAVLPYAHYFYSGVFGAGLMVLSKFPIVSTLFHTWTVNGYCHRIQHADWFGGKGVGLCKIRIGDQYIHLYNAHLHAEYSMIHDDYKAHRVIQAFDTAQFIEATRGDAAIQILAGDLNTKPVDISYKVVLYTSQMKDTCHLDWVATNECKHNSYTPKKVLKRNPNGFRIDHIFLRSADHIKTSILEYKLPLPDRVPGQKFSYSDHEAVMVHLKLETKQDGETCSIRHIEACISEDGMQDVKLTPPNTPIASVNGNTNKNSAINGDIDEECSKTNQDIAKLPEHLGVLQESIELCAEHLHKLRTDRAIYFTIALILLSALIIMAEFPVPHGYKTLYLLLKLTVFAVILFCGFMGSIWNLMERNGTISGKAAMEIKLQEAQYTSIKND